LEFSLLMLVQVSGSLWVLLEKRSEQRSEQRSAPLERQKSVGTLAAVSAAAAAGGTNAGTAFDHPILHIDSRCR